MARRFARRLPRRHERARPDRCSKSHVERPDLERGDTYWVSSGIVISGPYGYRRAGKETEIPMDRLKGSAEGSATSAASRMEVMGDMGAFADRVLGEIGRARRRVDIECFIVRADRLGASWRERWQRRPPAASGAACSTTRSAAGRRLVRISPRSPTAVSKFAASDGWALSSSAACSTDRPRAITRASSWSTMPRTRGARLGR